MSKNSICHIEISTTDTKKSSEFYQNLFSWKMNQAMGEAYILYQPESGPGGGISKVENFTPGSGVVFYVEVDDIEAYLQKAEELGGWLHTSKTAIPGIGWFGLFKDLDGNTIGLFTPNQLNK